MSCWQKVAKTTDIPVGEGRTFSVDGQLVAVFNLDNQFFALNDLCPHMGASLAEGSVEGGAVTCPWHAWRFCVKDGTWLDNPRASVKTETYPVHVDGDTIFVDVGSSRDVAP
jgi:nitrite reductase (NADH) small subunit/3-phenylpropionate/trans-cinnamate dioxygenase ferredoxin subunit